LTLQACQLEKVPRLVYTSSASVVFDGRDLNNVDESAPYAVKPLDYYTQTKVGPPGWPDRLVAGMFDFRWRWDLSC